ncbi:hypothetical protein HDV00_006345 [Rhizophlyctis rosea]|nr:hypothetical protein HDV00_006345 [Rhizophlyctis rosea]
MGVAENSGPDCNFHHDHAVDNFISLLKVVRAQHKAWMKEGHVLESLTPSTTSQNIVTDMITNVTIPFFQIVGRRVKFYVLAPYFGEESLSEGDLQVDGEGEVDGMMFVLDEWTEEVVPEKDDDLCEMVGLIRAMLVFRNMLHAAAERANAIIKRARRLKAMGGYASGGRSRMGSSGLARTPGKGLKGRKSISGPAASTHAEGE